MEELEEFKDPKRNPLRNVHELLEQRRQEKLKQKAITDHPSEDSDSYDEMSNSDPDWKRDSATCSVTSVKKEMKLSLLYETQRKTKNGYQHRRERGISKTLFSLMQKQRNKEKEENNTNIEKTKWQPW